jgi:hypothetical protein
MTRPETPFLKQVREDFKRVLLNPFEFGRTCLWNGEPLEIAEGAREDDEAASDAHGVNLGKKLIVCRDVDLSPTPIPGEAVILDGESWYIEDVKTPFGHLMITLIRNTA